MYFDRWAKTKPVKSGKYPPPHDHKTAAAQIFLDHGRFVRNTPKTEQNQSRTNADFCQIASCSLSVTTAAADPHTKRKPPTAFYFSPHSIAKGRLFYIRHLFKTLHQIAQYSAQYFMQYFTVYFSICSCISGYYVVYFNQDKERHNDSEA